MTNEKRLVEEKTSIMIDNPQKQILNKGFFTQRGRKVSMLVFPCANDAFISYQSAL